MAQLLLLCHLIKMPSNGSPCMTLNHSSMSCSVLNPSAFASSHACCSLSGNEQSPVPMIIQISVIRIGSTSLMTDSRRVRCLLRYGFPVHCRRLIRCPVLGIRFGVGRMVWHFSPDKTFGANSGLNILTWHNLRSDGNEPNNALERIGGSPQHPQTTAIVRPLPPHRSHLAICRLRS